MIVEAFGKVKPYYIQSLCLLYFPGEKFSSDTSDKKIVVTEEQTGDTIKVTAKAFVLEKEQTAACERKTGRDGNDIKTANICAGAAVCKALSEITGFTPPWGSLVGVRCTKIPRMLLDEGYGSEEIVSYLTEAYLLSEEKASMAVRVAQKEKEIISSLIPDGVSVYISIPFCPTRCAYCSFVSYSTPRLLGMIPEYLERLCEDIKRLFGLIRSANKKVDTIYIGGGTPTTLDESQLEILLGTIENELIKCGANPAEYTLEAGRPDTITEGKLASAARHGVSRISINPQSTSDDVLASIGRAHTVEDFFGAYSIAKKSGIKHINTDLIAGLPGDSIEKFEKSLSDVVSLGPDNITVHTFSVKRSSAFKESGEDVYDAFGTAAAECVSFASSFLRDKGYAPYYMYRQKNMVGGLENTGYSLPGCEGKYNILIMEEVQSILACGAGAVSKIVTDKGEEKIKRLFLPKYPYEYLREDSYPEILSEIEKALI